LVLVAYMMLLEELPLLQVQHLLLVVVQSTHRIKTVELLHQETRVREETTAGLVLLLVHTLLALLAAQAVLELSLLSTGYKEK
jgi:hypothetical protein